MYAIFIKEIRAFFSSLTGYIAVVIFLLANAWFMWLAPGDFNVLDNGYADLNSLFTIAPWIFLFLLPAVTMRSFAEEKKTGTLELLLTKPITHTRLIAGKYLAGVALAVFALLPTLCYLYSVYMLGNPVGNVDMGGAWGSYIGLFFLAAVYAAIGIFASSITVNQIVAYIVAAVLCFFFYIGFDGLSQFSLFAPVDNFVLQLGVNEHYKSVSRGVVDSRDVLYFVSIIVFFLALTKLTFSVSKKRVWTHRGMFAGFVVLLLILNTAVRHVFFRIDLTGDKRYTLADVSKQIMKNTTANVHVEIFLEGNMPVQMKKLRTTIRETLDELNVYAGNRVRYTFINLEDEVADGDERATQRLYTLLQQAGLSPFVVQEQTGGSNTERILFPGALVSCTKSTPDGDSVRIESREIAVNFIQSDAQANPESNILLAQENVEYELVNAINLLCRERQQRIAFVEGHGELDEYEVGDICREIAPFSRIDRLALGGRVGALNAYDLVIVARPMQPWSDADKFVLDQYVMHGGRVAWFLDEVHVHHDSLSSGRHTFALNNDHNLDDLLFKYGIRINKNVLQDMQCSFLPVNIAMEGQSANFKPAPWTYYPLLTPPDGNDITRGLNLIKSEYPSSIDTVNHAPGVRRQFLLHTSAHSRAQTIPLPISLAETAEQLLPEHFNRSFLPVAALTEGVFRSAYANRPTAHYNNGRPFTFAARSEPAKMIVVADGDIIRNDVIRRADGTRILPLGFDRYTEVQFGNKNLVKNMALYLLDNNDVMQIRRRQWQLRLLDKHEIQVRRSYWTTLNTFVPPALALLLGGVFIYARRRGALKVKRE
ncbi:MAG: gliding motility-associated ABC transporter substrate-binding protein GldG [Prevotellaceae bacterium]|nr:gliding motility-associated ABC transporter substrate-binding protein GldG [Prevotellaceae bacterium]